MFSGPRTEDRNIYLGAEISKDSLTFSIHLIERREPTVNAEIKKPWGSTPREGQKCNIGCLLVILLTRDKTFFGPESQMLLCCLQ